MGSCLCAETVQLLTTRSGRVTSHICRAAAPTPPISPRWATLPCSTLPAFGGRAHTRRSGSQAGPLGKLHKEGLDLLRSHGWKEVARDDDADRVPGLAFTTRKGGFGGGTAATTRAEVVVTLVQHKSVLSV